MQNPQRMKIDYVQEEIVDVQQEMEAKELHELHTDSQDEQHDECDWHQQSKVQMMSHLFRSI